MSNASNDERLGGRCLMAQSRVARSGRQLVDRGGWRPLSLLLLSFHLAAQQPPPRMENTTTTRLCGGGAFSPHPPAKTYVVATAVVVAVLSIGTLGDALDKKRSSLPCRVAFHLFFLQDFSWNLETTKPQLQDQLPRFVEELTETYEGSLVALGGFSDIPVPDLGWRCWLPKDQCFNLLVDFTSNHTPFEIELQDATPYSGRDEKEAQLLALHHAARGPFFPQRAVPDVSPVRVVALSTDGPFHVAGDAAAMVSRHDEMRLDSRKAWYMPPFNFTVVPNNGDGTLQCDGDTVEDYPTIEQVANALKSIDSSVLFLVASDVQEHYWGLHGELLSMGVDNSVIVIEDDSSNLKATLEQGLEKIAEDFCQTTTSTTTTSAYTSGYGNTGEKTDISTGAILPKSTTVVVGSSAAAGGAAAFVAAAAFYAVRWRAPEVQHTAPPPPLESLGASEFAQSLEPRSVCHEVEVDMYV